MLISLVIKTDVFLIQVIICLRKSAEPKVTQYKTREIHIGANECFHFWLVNKTINWQLKCYICFNCLFFITLDGDRWLRVVLPCNSHWQWAAADWRNQRKCPSSDTAPRQADPSGSLCLTRTRRVFNNPSLTGSLGNFYNSN